jgi:predicted RNase H-like HicB family nuclease
MTDGEIPVYLDLHFTGHEEDGQWVSECVELGVASCGDTAQEALEAVLEATNLYIETLKDEGELERVFRERSIRVIPAAELASQGEISARIPVATGFV